MMIAKLLQALGLLTALGVLSAVLGYVALVVGAAYGRLTGSE